MTISNERLAEMVGAGVPCVPASPGEIVAIVQELRSLRPSPAGVEPAAWAEVMSGKVYTVRLDRSLHCTEPLYPASALAALQSRVRELEGALKPFADRCDEGVRPDDSDNDGMTVRTKYLRAARAALSPVQQDGGKHAD